MNLANREMFDFYPNTAFFSRDNSPGFSNSLIFFSSFSSSTSFFFSVSLFSCAHFFRRPLHVDLSTPFTVPVYINKCYFCSRPQKESTSTACRRMNTMQYILVLFLIKKLVSYGSKESDIKTSSR